MLIKSTNKKGTFNCDEDGKKLIDLIDSLWWGKRSVGKFHRKSYEWNCRFIRDGRRRKWLEKKWNLLLNVLRDIKIT